MSSIKIHSGWQGFITLDVSKSDTFACQSIAEFFCPIIVSDLGYCLRISGATPKQARAFVAHCEE